MALRRWCRQGAFEARLIFVAVLVSGAWAQRACELVGGNPCICETNNGMSLNISDYTTTFTQAFPGSDGFDYAYSPCQDLLDLGNLCQKGSGSAGCQGNSGTPYVVTGKIAGVSFVYNETRNAMEATYIDGTDERKTKVTFICTNDASPTITETGENPSLTYNFEVKGMASCITKTSSGGGISPGSVLLIVFFVILVLYFVVGVIYMSAMRDAKGTNRVPNRDFWVSVPGLIKDGILFIFSPCRRSSSGGNYEKL